MIELMIYRSGNLAFLPYYLFVSCYLCYSIWDGYNRKLLIRIADRNDEFKKHVELSINDTLWNAIRKEKLTYQDAQSLGFRIMRFNWR